MGTGAFGAWSFGELFTLSAASPDSSLMGRGVFRSATISTVQTNGARTSFVYAGRKCRINNIKDKVVEWLDPKPVTCQNIDLQTIDFKGYLGNIK